MQSYRLLDLGKMSDSAFAPGIPAAEYANPAERVEQWRSENSGDVVILANMIEGRYYFDTEPKSSNHGSLTYADAVIPLAFSYPGATAEDAAVDTLLASVTEFLKGALPAGGLASSPVEEQAMERAVGLKP